MVLPERSIDIALAAPEAPQPQGHLVVVPITSTESKVAENGLSAYLDGLYGSVLQKSNPDRALKAVFDFLSDDMDLFRQRARNLEHALNPAEHSSHSRAYTAAGIAYLLRGMRSQKSDVWLTRKAGQDQQQLIRVFNEVRSADDLTFHEYSEWAYRQSIKNGIYWRRQLEDVRSNKRIGELRQAINESDHYLFEV